VSIKSLFFDYWDVIGTYVMVFSTMGLGIALPGPTLKLLGRQVGEASTSTMSTIFIARALGFLFGSISAGQVVDRYTRARSQMFCVMCVLGSALMTIVYPMATSLAQLIVISFIAALFMGGIDNLMNVFVLSLFKKHAPPFLQALHAGFALGAFLAPAFVAMFVTDLPDGTSTGPYEWSFYTMGIYMLLIAGLFVYQLARGRDTVVDGPVRLTDEDETIGAQPDDVEMEMVRQLSPDPYQIPPALPEYDQPVTPTYKTKRSPGVGAHSPSVLEAGAVRVAGAPVGMDGDLSDDLATQSPVVPASAIETPRVTGGWFSRMCAALSNAWKTGARNRGTFGGTGMVLVAEGALLLWLYVGTETGYGNLISTFATDKEFMGEKSAALLASVYWGCFFVGRVVGVFASLRFRPRQLIIADLIGALVFTVLLFVFSGSERLLWVCSGGLGLSVGSFYAGVMAWLDEVLEMSGQVISIVVVWVCVSEALFPMAMALFMEIQTDNFVYFSLGMMAGCCGVFAAMDWYRNKHTVI
jgi:fucose permease